MQSADLILSVLLHLTMVAVLSTHAQVRQCPTDDKETAGGRHGLVLNLHLENNYGAAAPPTTAEKGGHNYMAGQEQVNSKWLE